MPRRQSCGGGLTAASPLAGVAPSLATGRPAMIVSLGNGAAIDDDLARDGAAPCEVALAPSLQGTQPRPLEGSAYRAMDPV